MSELFNQAKKLKESILSFIKLSQRGLIALFLCLAFVQAEVYAKEVNPNDPYENYNRKVFAFNEQLDKWLLKPVAQGYRFITPKFFRQGVNNFFSNIKEVPNFANNLLQGKPQQAGKDLARFGINSTLGIFGLVDVATPITGWQASDEDFGQTLNTWGVPEGPYIVWPLLGGQHLSHTASLPADIWLFEPIPYVVEDTNTRLGISGLYITSLREGVLDAESIIHGDRYTFIRDAYLQNRQFLLNDGRIDNDPFLNDDDFSDEDFDDLWFDDE